MPPSRRLVRRRPLTERIKAYLDPLDFLLWLSEELETSDWEQWQKNWAAPLGIGLNLAMIVARSNTGSHTDGYNDVFGEVSTRSMLFGWLVGVATSLLWAATDASQATFMSQLLSLLSFANAAYTFYRRRHYRLFEASIDEAPSTPSAHRVKVESSPMSSSPLRFLSNIISDTAVSRAHPNPQKDVWELSVWDPTPLCLQMFCLFSPGHILVYWLFLPTAATDARPSVTVFKTIALAALLSTQLYFLQSHFSQQSKDAAVIHKEVLHEYDTKFVHPRTQHVMRDVGTQFSGGEDSFDAVEEFYPVTVVNTGFRTNPNPNYMGHVDPDAPRPQDTPRRQIHTKIPPLQTPMDLRTVSSPVGLRPAIRPPQYRASTGSGDGGSLGVYSHAQSPLKKSVSTNFPQNQRLARVQQSPMRRESGRF